jgi:hypothetical protein
MMQTLERDVILDTLLNTLEVERYVRAPLLLSVLDELDATDRHAEAAALARQMLVALRSGRLRDDEFSGAIARLRALIGARHAA